MGWRRWRDYEPRPRRPAVTKLNPDQLADLARKLNAAVSRSPVLAGLGVRVRAERGRFYVERVRGDRRRMPRMRANRRVGRLTPSAPMPATRSPPPKRGGSNANGSRGPELTKRIDFRRRATTVGGIGSRGRDVLWVPFFPPEELPPCEVPTSSATTSATTSGSARCSKPCAITATTCSTRCSSAS